MRDTQLPGSAVSLEPMGARRGRMCSGSCHSPLANERVLSASSRRAKCRLRSDGKVDRVRRNLGRGPLDELIQPGDPLKQGLSRHRQERAC